MPCSLMLDKAILTDLGLVGLTVKSQGLPLVFGTLILDLLFFLDVYYLHLGLLLHSPIRLQLSHV